jgi:formate/nitrite transporter FocA (FNT family)
VTSAVSEAFRRTVDEGVERLERSTPSLFATGMVGGIDVSIGVLAMLVVRHATGNAMWGAVAFTLGFVALTLANSELFTENFLVPISAIAARKASWMSLLRLWFGTLVFNLVGGWIVMGLAMGAFPDLRGTALVVGGHGADLGITGGALASAVLAGLAITLMTWMEHSTDAIGARLVAVVGVAFLLAAAPLLHVIVVSLEMFAALFVGASFGYADWLGVLLLAAAGNVLGGVGLVTVLRLVQVGPDEIASEQRSRR